MPGENLTRDEAEARAAVVRDPVYEIALDLTEDPERFTAVTTVEFGAAPGAGTFVDLVAERVLSIRLNEADLPVEAWDGSRLALAGLAATNRLTVVSVMRFSRTGEGLHRFVDPADGAVYCFTQMAVPDARRVFAVFDQPDVKGRFALTVTAPGDWTVLANEPGTQEPVGDGDALWRFPATDPIASYLVALAGGPFAIAEGECRSSDRRTIPLRVLGRASLAAHLGEDAMLETAAAGIRFYESAFGIPYPFAKSDLVFVPEYNWGAMENPGLITFNERYVFRSAPTDAQRERRAGVVLHELAHMWFGDLVTMRWWNDLWLNESFATFMASLAQSEATEWTDAWATFALDETQRGVEQDQLPSSHPVVAPIRDLADVAVNFDAITYAKGASVLKQLAAYVGRDAFLTGLGAYLRAHAWGSATLADLLADLEAASGRDLAAWSEAWLESAGVDTIEPEVQRGVDGTISAVAVRRVPPPGRAADRPHRVAVGAYAERDGALTRVARAELDLVADRAEVPGLDGAQAALLLPNDDGLTYAKIRLDPVSEAAARASVARIADPLARTVVWGALWDATRDGLARPRDFVALVALQGLTEPLSALRGALLRRATLAAEEYVAPEARAGVLREFTAALLAALDAAAAGSDAQLQLAGAVARVAATEADAAAVARIASGGVIGLPLGPELAWALTTARVVAGAAGEDEIAAALAADRTAAGAEWAALARAAVPTADAKEAAWAAATSGVLPNETLRRTLEGFGRVADPALLAPYAGRYAHEVEHLWSAHPGTTGRDLAVLLYPRALADEALLDTAAGWLDHHPGADAPLRRIVAEQHDRTRRALAAQAADRA